MDEREFLSLADATMDRLERIIESALDAADVDYDSELQPGGILELTFEDDSKIIINRHAAAREIWVAARAGGFHYRYDGGRWIGTRDGEELFTALSRLISGQAGAAISLQG